MSPHIHDNPEHNYSHGTVSITPLQQMIASSTGAMVTSFFVTPLDVIKTRLQAQAKPKSFTKGHCFLYCNGLMDHLCSCVEGVSMSSEWYKRPNVHFTGSLDAAIKIARYEGIASLWSGLPPTLIMAIPATVVYFTSYEQLKAFVSFDSHDRSVSNQLKAMTSGITARIFAVSLISPVEMIRVKVQSQNYSYGKVLTALKDSIKSNGPLSLWRGLGPTLLRDVPFSGMYWVGYESIKSAILNAKETTTVTFSESFISGAISGSFAAVVTLPFDVIKTRCQIDLGEAELMGRTPTSTWTLIHRIYIQEGFKALYTGLLPRLLKIAPSCAIMISSFEYFKNFFMEQNKQISKKIIPENTDLQKPNSRVM